MNWSELRVHTTNEAVEPISNILHENGANGVVIEDSMDLVQKKPSDFGEIYELDPAAYPVEGVYIKAYLPINTLSEDTVNEIKQAINQLADYDIDLGRNQVTLSEVKEEDWATAWKQYYKPVKISEKMTITPMWEDYRPESSDERIIELDPGMAFGTGTHSTTVLSIQALERYVEKDDTVIDVGCGSGVLSIAAVKLGAEKLFAYDLDEIAVKSTKMNVELNKLDTQIETRQNDLLNGVEKQADIIVSNILAEIIVRFIPDAWINLKNQGIFITSGIIQGEKQFVKDQLIENEFTILEINEMEDWVTIIAQK